MSIEQANISEDDARKKAEYILRFKIGPQYSLGDIEVNGSDFVFPIFISPPRVIFDELRQNPVDVDYLDPTRVGKIRVSKKGETEYTHPQTVYRRVRDYEKEIQQAVEKALISSAAKDFTQLPFPENRYAPVEDILAEVILRNTVPLDEIEALDSPDDNERGKYAKYVEELESIDLLKTRDGVVGAGNFLKEARRDNDKNHEILNTALAHYFRENVNDLEKIHGVLGPYLAVAGFYYRLAIESDTLPKVDESSLRDAFEKHYQGKGRQTDLKLFKLSRYLLHLERAGILKPITQSNRRVWYGVDKIKDDLEEQTHYVGAITAV
ncbi:hypothetical protein [Halomarina pelagica]|uniref:hypothetical protein n=1 Tax=Halomarina pelagica TaxID=2961599 RepID=UPI0020C592D8|nr:hypothetical protein [Halomarina sp. BND7]